MTAQSSTLVVDDNPDLREAVALFLRYAGKRVFEAADGREALESLEAEPGIGLIVLDLMMPVMDGLTFLDRKARGRHAAIPVVIFSSCSARSVNGYRCPISVVSKTEGLDALLAAVHTLEGAAHA